MSRDAQGRGRISNHEYFAKLVRSIPALVGDTTEHGFVFRVDLALRPNGNSGPPNPATPRIPATQGLSGLS